MGHMDFTWSRSGTVVDVSIRPHSIVVAMMLQTAKIRWGQTLLRRHGIIRLATLLASRGVWPDFECFPHLPGLAGMYRTGGNHKKRRCTHARVGQSRDPSCDPTEIGGPPKGVDTQKYMQQQAAQSPSSVDISLCHI